MSDWPMLGLPLEDSGRPSAMKIVRFLPIDAQDMHLLSPFLEWELGPDAILDPATSVSLNLERLRSSILILCHLLR